MCTKFEFGQTFFSDIFEKCLFGLLKQKYIIDIFEKKIVELCCPAL